jgi:hypothetical protein
MSNQHSPYSSSNHVSGMGNNAPRPYGIEDIRYFVDVYVLHHRSQLHSPHTISTYIDRLGKFVWFLEQQGYPLALEHITSAHIRAFFVCLQEQRQGQVRKHKPRRKQAARSGDEQCLRASLACLLQVGTSIA